MTESEWLACTDPQKMLFFLSGKGSDRKLRLLACACCRFPQLLEKKTYRHAVRTAERYADGLASDYDLFDAAQVVRSVSYSEEDVSRWKAAAVESTTYQDAWIGARDALSRVRLFWPSDIQQRCLHDIFGPLPFRPVTVSPFVKTWNDSTIPRLAERSYRKRLLPSGHLDPQRLAVLADALEEAGADAELVEHLRGPGPHWRGCFVVDFLTGRE